MPVLPKSLDNPYSWAFFERYSSIENYGAETRTFRIIFFGVVALGTLVNLGNLEEAELGFGDISVKLISSPVISIICLGLAIFFAIYITIREKLESNYYHTMYTFFRDAVPIEGLPQDTTNEAQKFALVFEQFSQARTDRTWIAKQLEKVANAKWLVYIFLVAFLALTFAAPYLPEYLTETTQNSES